MTIITVLICYPYKVVNTKKKNQTAIKNSISSIYKKNNECKNFHL